MIGYLDEVMKPLALSLPKICDMLKNLKIKMEIKIINYEKLLKKYKTIWTKIEELKSIKLNALVVYGGRYIKIKIECVVIKIILIFTVEMYQKIL